VILAPFPLFQQSHDAKLLLSRAWPPIWRILCLTRLYACWSCSFSLWSRSRSLSFVTMIWAARSSRLRRFEIVLSRASTSGMVFRSPLSPAVSSRLFSSCVPSCRASTVSLFPPPVGGNSQRPPFPLGVHCNCR